MQWLKLQSACEDYYIVWFLIRISNKIYIITRRELKLSMELLNAESIIIIIIIIIIITIIINY